MNNLTVLKLNSHLRYALSFLTMATLVITAPVVIARGQETSATAAAPSPSATTTPEVTAAPTPIPLAEVVTQAEAVSANLRNIEADLASVQITGTVEAELPALMQEIDTRLDENQKILNSRPSLETLKNLETDWKTLGDKLPSWGRDLTTRATGLDREMSRLKQLDQTWVITLDRAESTQTAPAQGDQKETTTTVTPPEILQRMQSVIVAIKQAREAIQKRRTQILTLQNRVAEQETRIAQALASVGQVREETISRLFVKDSPAIWSAAVWSRAGQNLLQDSQNSFTAQWTALGAYARRQSARFILNAVMLLVLVLILYRARRRVQPLVAAEPSLEGVARVFNVPIATALSLRF